MSAYYNEIDPQAAAWLRQLIGAKVIPDGEVDERSIEDIQPSDLRGFVQCHFFAGIGGWSEGLRIAGWPDDRPVWTGSCPCQSFSAAGTRTGFADKRHLWPAWFHLIEQCRPPVVFGEQVDAAVKFGWLDLVQADMEAAGYAVGRAVIPAAGIGAPHGRHRLWFVADANRGQRDGLAVVRGDERDGKNAGRTESVGGAAACRVAGELGDTDKQQRDGGGYERSPGRRESSNTSFWNNADWIACTDGKARPVEPGTFPLAHGIPARVGRLRGYGNALVPQVAAEFVAAYLAPHP